MIALSVIKFVRNGSIKIFTLISFFFTLFLLSRAWGSLLLGDVQSNSSRSNFASSTSDFIFSRFCFKLASFTTRAALSLYDCCQTCLITYVPGKLNCTNDEVRCRATKRCVPRRLVNTEQGCELSSKVTYPCRNGTGMDRS